jgi:hypothetical protein
MEYTILCESASNYEGICSYSYVNEKIMKLYLKIGGKSYGEILSRPNFVRIFEEYNVMACE